MPYQNTLHATCNSPAQATSTVSFFLRGSHPSHLNSLGSIQAKRLPLGTVNLYGMHLIPPLTITDRYQFTLWLGEACMEFTSCQRVLHSQPTGSTEIQTHDLHIQSPKQYPLSHHVFTSSYVHSSLHQILCVVYIILLYVLQALKYISTYKLHC